MSVVVNALLPVLLVIATGHLVARMGIITGEQWRGIERIAYFVLFPAIIIATVAQTDFMALPAFEMSATLVASVVAMAAIALALQPLLRRHQQSPPSVPPNPPTPHPSRPPRS